MVLTRSRVREALPAEKPRGIEPDRVPLPSGAPARAVAVLADLCADDSPAAQAQHAVDMALAPLRKLLAKPLPTPTDWIGMLPAIWHEVDWDLGVAVDAASVEALGAIYNGDVRWWFDTTREVIFGARELCEQLVADVADSIAAEVAV